MRWIFLIALVAFTVFCFYKGISRHCKQYKTYEEYLKAINYEGRYRWRALGVILMIADMVIFFFYII